MSNGLNLFKKLSAYNIAKAELCQLKSNMFPVGCVVSVDTLRFKGYGIVHDGGKPDEVFVLLETAITMCPIECCNCIHDTTLWPQWIVKCLANRNK